MPGARELSLKSTGGVYKDHLLSRTKRNYAKVDAGLVTCFPVTMAGSQNAPVAAQVELIISQATTTARLWMGQSPAPIDNTKIYRYSTCI